MKRYRTPEQIDDGLYPEFNRDPHDERRKALLDILCCIPDIDYQRLTKCFEELEWFIPEAEKSSGFFLLDARTEIQVSTDGWTSPKSKIAVFLYLSPAMEALPPDELRRVVADKLAHVVLHQEIFIDPDEETSKRDEESRILKMSHWGL